MDSVNINAIHETAEEYHARKAMSASMAWAMVSKCPRKAWYESPFNPDQPPPEQARHFDIGTALHLAVLEPHLLDERTVKLPYGNYRTKEAQQNRDQAYVEGRTPLLEADWDLVENLRKAVSEQTDLLTDGEAEVSALWDYTTSSSIDIVELTINGEVGVSVLPQHIYCKGRADYLTTVDGRLTIIDLKTAACASEEAFQRAMIRDGHHLRAAWYREGFRAADYIYLVVEKDPPFIVQPYRVAERSEEWGYRLMRKAIDQFRQCMGEGRWPGYSAQTAAEDKIINTNLPSWAEHQLEDMDL
jgi:hypothetical protein